MRVVRIKNLQESADTYCGMEIAAGAYYQLQSDTEIVRFANDQKVQDHLSLESPKIVIGDGDKYFSVYLDAKHWLEGSDPRNTDNRPIHHSTPRKIGTYTYYSGSGDDADDAANVGGGSDDAELFCGHHTVGQDLVQSMYAGLNTISNETHIYGGYIQWSGAKNDYLKFEIVPRLTEYSAGSNTNFNLYGGFLIIPAAGTGLITVDSADMILVQNVPNEFGVRPAGYWDATFNPSTKLFENITPNLLGTGEFNMFGVEIVLSRFVNKFLMLGDGIMPLTGHDISQIGHGGLLKITSKTRGDDHEWWWNANIVLYRKKTC